jgi:hypothetical protein
MFVRSVLMTACRCFLFFDIYYIYIDFTCILADLIQSSSISHVLHCKYSLHPVKNPILAFQNKKITQRVQSYKNRSNYVSN